MASKTSNPAALADAGRVWNSFNVLPTLNGSENSLRPSETQARCAAFVPFGEARL